MQPSSLHQHRPLDTTVVVQTVQLLKESRTFGAMFAAQSSCYSVGAAACKACHCLAVVFLALLSHGDGLGYARVRCVVSIGAVLDADKLAKDLGVIAV